VAVARPLLAALLLHGAASLASPASPASPADDRPYHQLVRDAWSVEQGLPQISGEALAQTPDGSIWIGTQRGLARFDGYEFRVFAPNEVPALGDQWIWCLTVDRSGTLWIGTGRGAARYRDGRFEALALGSLSGRAEPIVYDVRQADDGTIWLATSDGAVRVGADGVPQAGPLRGEVTGALATGTATWFGSVGAVIELTAAGPRRIPLPGPTADAPVWALAAHGDALWIGTQDGLLVLRDGRIAPVALPREFAGANVNALHADRAGTLWVGSDRGLLRFRDGVLREALPKADGDSPGEVLSFLEDHERNLWLGTRERGVFRTWDGRIDRFSRRAGLDDPSAWGIVPERDGTLLVGTASGLRRFADGRFARIPGFAALDGIHVTGATPADGALWIGSLRGLWRAAGGRTVPAAGSEALRSEYVYDVFADRDGTLYACSSGGLFRREVAGFERVPLADGDGRISLRTVRRTPDGRLLALGRSGLFEVRDGRLQRIVVNAAEPSPALQTLLIGPDQRTLLGGADGTLWVEADGEWRPLRARDGLPENTAGTLAVDRAGTLWVAGVLGLYRVPYAALVAQARRGAPPAGAEMVLSISGAVPGARKSQCCNFSGAWSGRLIGDDLWLPTPDGILRVPVLDLPRNPVAPQVRVARLKVGDSWRDVDGSAPLALPPAARDLEFAFSVLSYRDPKSTRLRFQLEGYDPDWREVEPGRPRHAAYTNLPPGRYRFLVRGANDSGVWSARDGELAFSIAPRFHETPWARLLLVLLLAGAILGGHRLRVYALRRDRDRLEALVREHTASLVAANRALQETSETDGLTGLRNRRFIYGKLPADLSTLTRALRDGRAAGRAVGLLLVDIDHFKLVNDRFGHSTGDEVLCSVAGVLRGALREGDYAVRWGGEEFLLVLREMASGEVGRLADKLRARVAAAELPVPGPRPLRITVSIGAIEFPVVRATPDALTWEDHVELADLALYQAKHRGRNATTVVRAAPDAAVKLGAARPDQTAAALVEDGVVELEAPDVG